MASDLFFFLSSAVFPPWVMPCSLNSIKPVRASPGLARELLLLSLGLGTWRRSRHHFDTLIHSKSSKVSPTRSANPSCPVFAQRGLVPTLPLGSEKERLLGSGSLRGTLKQC